MCELFHIVLVTVIDACVSWLVVRWLDDRFDK